LFTFLSKKVKPVRQDKTILKEPQVERSEILTGSVRTKSRKNLRAVGPAVW